MNIFKRLSNYKKILKYIKFNKLLFKKKSNHESSDIILVEVNDIYPSIISYSMLSNYLAKKYKSKIIGYKIYDNNLFVKILNYFSPISLSNIYKSFGVSEIFTPVKKKEKIIRYKFSSKKDLLEFKKDNIKIGDLIYDSYLRKNYEATVDLESENFAIFFNNSLELFNFWNHYFKNNKVKAIIASHSVYNLGIPIRIAIHYEVDAFLTGISFLNYFNKNRVCEVNSMAYNEYFNGLSSEQKASSMKIAKNELKKKFSKQGGYANSTEVFQSTTPFVIEDNKYQTFGEIKKKNVFKKNGKPNILVTAHCFYDSPHAIEDLLFNDFYDWIDHLGKLSNETDYNWYLKKHPHTANKGLNDKTLNKFIKRYPKLQILDETINNSELMNEQVDLTLTVYGSVGYEFPYFGIPVLLASPKTSYENYNFCIQPSSIEEYDSYIKDLKKTKYKIDKNEIYKFYFNRYLASWSLLDNYINHKINLKNDFFGPMILEIWIKQFDDMKLSKINTEISQFINNKKYRLISDDAHKVINFSRI